MNVELLKKYRAVFVQRTGCGFKWSYCMNGAIVIFLVVLFVAGCTGRRLYAPRPKVVEKQLAHMGYTIQVGAFSKVENAARLSNLLKDKGLDATYFVASTGLYKVRFGNFTSKNSAREKAERLKASGTINEYYIVSPDEYAIAKRQTHGDVYVRNELVKTAQSFVGVPYLWGGSSANTGFDCSGLAMTVYQLNGLDLPRSSKEQFEEGTPVNKEDLINGDLVFFATGSKNKVSHVGVYVGDDKFIHAPGKGKNIRVDSMSRSYYKKRYIGGRTYI